MVSFLNRKARAISKYRKYITKYYNKAYKKLLKEKANGKDK